MNFNDQIQAYDVGGTRSQRRKWVHIFQDASLVIYCVNLSSYDENLAEDETANAMVENINLWKDILYSPRILFKKVNIVLLFTHVDVFLDKIKRIPISKYFPEYKGL